MDVEDNRKNKTNRSAKTCLLKSREFTSFFGAFCSYPGMAVVELEPLQRAMEKGGNRIHFDDALVPSDSAVKSDTVADIGHI